MNQRERDVVYPLKSTKRHEAGSGGEEIDWYAGPEGRRETRREFENALKNGTLMRSAGARVPRTDPDVLAELVERGNAKATVWIWQASLPWD